MPRKSEQDALADAIMRNWNGQVIFNFGEVSKITGYGINTIARRMSEAGIPVLTDGKSKKINVYQLAHFLTKDRISATEEFDGSPVAEVNA